jgi:hypothetical protein
VVVTPICAPTRRPPPIISPMVFDDLGGIPTGQCCCSPTARLQHHPLPCSWRRKHPTWVSGELIFSASRDREPELGNLASGWSPRRTSRTRARPTARRLQLLTSRRSPRR